MSRTKTKPKRQRALTPKQIEGLRISEELCAAQMKGYQKKIADAMRLMDTYKVPDKEGTQQLSLVQRTKLLLRHLVALEARVLDSTLEIEELEEEVDNLEFELTAALGEADPDDKDDDGDGEEND